MSLSFGPRESVCLGAETLVHSLVNFFSHFDPDGLNILKLWMRIKVRRRSGLRLRRRGAWATDARVQEHRPDTIMITGVRSSEVFQGPKNLLEGDGA
jgi:hypothetical protein